MPNDSLTLIGIAVGAVIIIWLVFSVLKKVIGLVLIAAIVGVIAFIWLNPELASQLWSQAQLMLGMR
jgi:hypothetical protein